jgi:FkbM family methyltransferase
MNTLLEALMQPMVRLAYPYGTVRRIRRGPLSGMRYLVRPGMGFSFAWGRETMNWGWMHGRIRPGMVVYDVGGNRGQMALFFAQLVGPAGRVVSFEPVPAVFRDLVFNVQLNGLDNVTAVEAAASDVAGAAQFAFDTGRPTQGKLSDCEPDNKIRPSAPLTVRTCALDHLAGTEFPPPAFVKIDTEGGAGKVLRGAQRILREYRPELYIELHGPEERQAVRDYVQPNGYTVKTLAGKVVSDPSSGSANPLWCIPD